jgi:pyruvate ferredoxin oxidoreductase alpha subunit
VVSDGVRKALSGIVLKGYTVIAGLGGRSITKRSLINLLKRADKDELEALSFLDLNWDVVNRELERGKAQRRAGPSAENILRDLHATQGAVGRAA